ncbi:putative receptor-like protein kinase [Hibiscus syriacus]|uniref:Receptor-like protein kinase n=1 Tax=Hibiscus syriacus TaxID=106335 RepID=A0A6A2WRK3_HIBSY|nr:putative receptor-like protein kinase [Hibiscus syriacus]
MMRKKLLLLLLCFVSFHETIVVFAVQRPVLSPISSPFCPGSEEHRRMSLSKKMLIALSVACSSLGVIIASLFCLWICYKKNSLKPLKNNANSSVYEDGFQGGFCFIYGLQDTCRSYQQVSSSNILGIGGFGCVYKAQIVDGSYAAVKKLECSSHDAEQEFQNEVDLLSNFKHPNIISLLNFSSYNETRFIVYELMQNGSLETQLHGKRTKKLSSFNLSQRRMKVAMDIVRGLVYLHEHCNPPVIHRDLKSSNILLDSDFNAKLSDFGLAVTDAAQNKNNLKLSGTLGYLAPEYLLDGKLTDKSDVYAFGIMLLELLLGRKPVEKLAPAQYISIITWAMPKLIDRTQLPNIVDPVIKNTMDLKHLYQVAAVAVLCATGTKLSSVDNRCSPLPYSSCSYGAQRDLKSWKNCSPLTRKAKTYLVQS